MKRLTITLSEEDFRSVMGAILKTGADFQVETVAEEGAKPELRHSQKKSADGKTPEQIIFDVLKNQAGRAQFEDFEGAGLDVGFNPASMRGRARKMVNEGKIAVSGKFFVMKIGGAAS